MSRWIAYDRTAEQALVQRFGHSHVQQQDGDQDAIFSAVLAADGHAAALFPARHGETVIVTRRPLRAVSGAAPPPRAYEATGFLGLGDEPIYDNQPEQPKTWWERLWE
jgi:hypothetical protein